MTLDLYKAQAARLADHLSAHHGVHLKRTSALEAVAALHGARNWNTLRAAALAEDTNKPEKQSVAESLPPFHHLLGPEVVAALESGQAPIIQHPKWDPAITEQVRRMLEERDAADPSRAEWFYFQDKPQDKP